MTAALPIVPKLRPEETISNLQRDRRKLEWLLDLSFQRRLSSVIAAIYVITCLLVYQPKSFRQGIGILLIKSLTILFPLACIWFGDEMDDYLITKTSPAGWVRLGGWCLLFLRLIITITLGY
jgi:hypothetical protein